MSNHAVSLKVLRLSSLSPGPDALLQLPSAFGTIYQSEYFTALVSLKLEHPATPVNNPRLVLQFQTPSQLLSQQKTTLDTLHAPKLQQHDSQLDTVIHHQIQQLGLHSLICTVSYDEPVVIDQNQQQPLGSQQPQFQTRSFRKRALMTFYKFQALNPLVINAKIFKNEVQKEASEENYTKEKAERLVGILNKLLSSKEKLDGVGDIDHHDQLHTNEISKQKLDLFRNYLHQFGSNGDGNDDCFVEISIQNQALKPLNLDLKIIHSQDESVKPNENESSSRFKVIDFSNQLVGNINGPLNPSWPGDKDATKSDFKRQEGGKNNQISPGDIYQYSFKIEEKQVFKKPDKSGRSEDEDEDLATNNEQENNNNRKEGLEPEELKLEVNFTGLMGESGRLTKNLTQMMRASSAQQQRYSSPSAQLSSRTQYLSPDLDMLLKKNKARSNYLFRFEITQLPAQNAVKIGSKIHVRFKISIDLNVNRNHSLYDLLFWTLNSKLLNKLNLNLTYPKNSNNSIQPVPPRVSRLILLNSLPLKPISTTNPTSDSENFKEYQLDYQIISPPPLPPSIKTKTKTNQLVILQDRGHFLDLGRLSTGSSELDLLFNVPVASLGFVFSSS